MAEQWWSKYKPTEYSFAEWRAEANRLYLEENLNKDQIQKKIGYPVDEEGNAIKTTNKGSRTKPNFDKRTGDRAGQTSRRGAAATAQTVGEDVYNKGVVAPTGSGLQEHHKRVVGLYKPFFEGLNAAETKELAQWFVDEGAPLGNVEENLQALTEKEHEAIHTWMKENRMQVSGKKFPSFKDVPLNERFVAALVYLEQIQPAADEELAKITTPTAAEPMQEATPEPRNVQPEMVEPQQPSPRVEPDRVQDYMANRDMLTDTSVKPAKPVSIDPKLAARGLQEDLFRLGNLVQELRVNMRSGRFRI